MHILSARSLAIVGALFLSFFASVGFSAESLRQVTLLDEGWKFHRGDVPAEMFGKSQSITDWRWCTSQRGEDESDTMAAPGLKTDADPWQDARPGDDVFKNKRGFAWFRTMLPAMPAGQMLLRFESVDDNASVYLNGKYLTWHRDSNQMFDVPLDSVWRQDGPNELAVLVENTGGGGGVGKVALSSVGGKEINLSADNPINPTFDDSSWSKINVPHDYIVEGTYTPKADTNHGSLPLEPAWYRRTLTIPASAKGKRLCLEFNGVYRNSYMWINGRFIGGHYSGYTSFRFDITDSVDYGKDNVLTVRVDPTAFEGWWYEGGGIYRHVRLIQTEPVHVATEGGIFVSSTVPDVGNGVEANAELAIQTTLSNANAKSTDVAVLSEVLNARGAVVAQLRSAQNVAASTQTLMTQKIALSKATLWSLENPYLYTLRSTVLLNNKPVDQVSTNFGVRTIRFDADRGFFLNGKQVKIKGTCNHQDHAGVGIAMPDRLIEWRLEKLKEMGSNAYRCAHNAVAPELLDACDRMGMLVMDENRKLGDTQERLDEVVNMVKRDRNHPSIIIWSMCNEETHFQGTKLGAAIFKTMRETTRLYDVTRPISCAMNGGWFEPGLATEEEIVGFNYFPEQYDRYHKEHPNTPLYGSETGSEVLTRGVYTHAEGGDRYFGDKAKCYVSEYGVRKSGELQIAEKTWRAIAEREYMAGAFVWTGFDYKGETYPYGWPCINSHFGIMDMCGFPKDSYYYYQAAWSGKPVIHIMPHWNWPGQEGQEIEVWVHNNCKRVELFLNGESLGAQDSQPNQKLVWKVKYAPGKLEARGTMADGKEIKTAVETTGVPAGVVLEPDRTQLIANGTDVSMVTVKIVDEKGRRVPVADNEVTFSVQGAGKLIGVGSGDPSCHDSDKSDKRKVFNGLCQAIIQTGKTSGAITVTASSPNLKAGTVILKTNQK